MTTINVFKMKNECHSCSVAPNSILYIFMKKCGKGSTGSTLSNKKCIRI